MKFLVIGAFLAALIFFVLTESSALAGLSALFAAMNFSVFILYGYDKWASCHSRENRVPENILHLFMALGAPLGAFLARKVFNHKTTKQPFRGIFWTILVLQCTLGAYTLVNNPHWLSEGGPSTQIDPLVRVRDPVSESPGVGVSLGDRHQDSPMPIPPQSQQACQPPIASRYSYQLASNRDLDRALLKQATIEGQLAKLEIPGHAFVVYRDPYHVVMAGEFSSAPKARMRFAEAKAILGEGGFIRKMSSFCDALLPRSPDSCQCVKY